MSDDSYDDGLVHDHGWSGAHVVVAGGTSRFPVADISGARVPSTALNDDHLFCD